MKELVVGRSIVYGEMTVVQLTEWFKVRPCGVYTATGEWIDLDTYQGDYFSPIGPEVLP